MNKYKVVWYYGSVTNIEKKLDEKEVVANDFKDVKFLDILPEYERKTFEVNIKYCCRIIFLDEGKIWTIDYGSHSRFIWVEKL